MTFMDAGFILHTYLLSRTECNIVSDRTYYRAHAHWT